MPATMTEPQRELAAKYVPLAKHWAYKQAKRFPYLDADFYSDAYLALCDAARRFDPESGARFSTFALRRIKGSAADLIRFEFGHRNLKTVSLSARGSNGRLRIEVAADDRATEDIAADADDVRKLMTCLPERHRDLIASVYPEGRTQAEAARAMGVSSTWVNVIHTEAMGLMREYAAKGWDTGRA